MTLRGLQTATPSQPMTTAALVVSAISSSTPSASSSDPPDLYSSVTQLQAQTDSLLATVASLQATQASFRTHLASQLASLQQTFMDTLLISHPLPVSITPNIIFGSLPPSSPLWPNLGATSPPPQPTLTSQPSSTMPSPISSQNLSSPFFSTVTTASSGSGSFASAPSFGSLSPQPSFPQFTPYMSSHELPIYRPPKAELPSFYGDDVVGWLAMAERFIRAYHVPPHESVQTIANYFGPEPSIWMTA
ncbi:uncharacterized protein LOC133721582 [Rosa rugosa]|uniref:uncharacterized protein LOC133721582 n=1 Tax=Rosa rugosa TaxID=74645 RepID=UPI002B40FC81|nr:uncharacterized protein LOC133721582 [Rosa rugosa]